jgi:hypothetical protein
VGWAFMVAHVAEGTQPHPRDDQGKATLAPPRCSRSLNTVHPHAHPHSPPCGPPGGAIQEMVVVKFLGRHQFLQRRLPLAEPLYQPEVTAPVPALGRSGNRRNGREW